MNVKDDDGMGVVMEVLCLELRRAELGELWEAGASGG